MSDARALLERALDAESLATVADPFDGRTVPLVAPASNDEWQTLAELAGTQGWRLLPLGHGTKLDWTRPPERTDLVCTSRRTRGLVSYEPGEGTVSVRAGTPWNELERAVAEGGHALLPDVARGSGPGPTVGGVVAAGQSGWDRLRHGPVRDHVLGTRVLTGSGQIAKSGGRLVKNVTGYDLHRLHTGSFGTLGVLLEVSLRLAPAPERTVWCERRCEGRGPAFALVAPLRALPITPTAIALRGDQNGWRVGIHLGGSERVVAAERGRALAVLGDDTAAVDGQAARERLAHWRECELLEGWPDLFVTLRPSASEATLARIEAAARAHDLLLRVLVHPCVATLAVHVSGPDDARDAWLLALVPELRRALEPRGGRVFLRRASAPVRARLEPFGDPTGLALMRSLRERLDPTRLFASGRLFREL